MKRSRREPNIVDIHTDPREDVCLRVAAEWLGLDERTVRARIDEGRLQALQDGKVYRIRLDDLRDYDSARRGAA
jgi:excisionase family DNA binding protein